MVYKYQKTCNVNRQLFCRNGPCDNKRLVFFFVATLEMKFDRRQQRRVAYNIQKAPLMMLIARGPEKRAPPHSSTFFLGVGLIVVICPASEKGPPIYLVPVMTKCYVYISLLTG